MAGCSDTNCLPGPNLPCNHWGSVHSRLHNDTVRFETPLLAKLAIQICLPRVPTSDECGPFRNSDYAYEIIVNKVTTIERSSAWYTIVTWMFKPGVVAGYIIALWYLKTRVW